MLFLNYYRFGQVLIDKIAVRSGLAGKYQFRFENYEAFLNELDRSCGAILIGAHVGNWEVGENFFGEYAKKINIVMLDTEYKKIKSVLNKNLNPITHKIIPISETDFSHVYQIKNALENDEYVCFQGDRYLADKSSQLIEFFGELAKFPIGPFRLASSFEVPVIFYYAVREKGMQYRFKFTLAKRRKQVKKKAFADELLNLYVNSLEKIVEEYPEQWFNYYNFWK